MTYSCHIRRQDHGNGAGDVDFRFVGLVLVQVLDGHGHYVAAYLGVVVALPHAPLLVDRLIDDSRDAR